MGVEQVELIQSKQSLTRLETPSSSIHSAKFSSPPPLKLFLPLLPVSDLIHLLPRTAARDESVRIKVLPLHERSHLRAC